MTSDLCLSYCILQRYLRLLQQDEPCQKEEEEETLQARQFSSEELYGSWVEVVGCGRVWCGGVSFGEF